MTFDATPAAAGVDAVTGLSLGSASGYPNLAAIVRFNVNGTIDARNGGNYSSVSAIPYTAGTTYHFIMDVNAAAHTYSAYVMLGSVQTPIGLNYAFRTEQAAVPSLNNVGGFAEVASQTICNIAVSPAAPTITTQPVSQSVTPGQRATFSVVAAGTGPLTYQWMRSGTPVSGATSSSYTTPAAATSDNGASFTVVVTANGVSTTSSAATLTVSAAAVAPAITTQPLSRTVTVGQSASFSVANTGTAPMSYQWKKNGTPIIGATLSNYTTPPTTTSDNGAQFTVAVTNIASTATSNPATLTVAASSTGCLNPTGSSWVNSALPQAQTGSFRVTFDSTPAAAGVDAVTGLSLGSASGYPNLAAIVRFNVNGTIDARNGANYSSASAIPYTAGTTYHFIMDVNAAAHTYSAYVMLGSVQTPIGLSYAFRSEQANVASLDNVGTFAEVGSQTVCNIALSGTPGTPTPTPTPNPGSLALSLSPLTLSFGNVAVASSSAKTVTLTNAGTSNISISNTSISGAGFSVSGVPSGTILTAGQTATLNVTFSPAATGTVTGTITVSSTATNSPATISLTGSGTTVAVQHSVALSWTPSTSSVVGYNIYSSTVSGSSYSRLTASPAATPNFTDTTVQTGKTYYYVVTSVGANNVESTYSNQATAIIP